MRDALLQKTRALLIDLRDECNARLAGSFANHTHDLRGHVSDIDLVVPYVPRSDDWGERITDRPIDRAISVFDRHGVTWDSCVIGSIGSPRDLVALTRPVEVLESCWITPDNTYPARVDVLGVRFRTYRAEFAEPYTAPNGAQHQEH